MTKVHKICGAVLPPIWIHTREYRLLQIRCPVQSPDVKISKVPIEWLSQYLNSNQNIKIWIMLLKDININLMSNFGNYDHIVMTTMPNKADVIRMSLKLHSIQESSHGTIIPLIVASCFLICIENSKSEITMVPKKK